VKSGGGQPILCYVPPFVRLRDAGIFPFHMSGPVDAAVEKLAVRWSKLAKTCKLVPLGEAEASGTDTMYQCMLFELGKVPVPKSLLDKVDSKDKKHKIQMHINATLFHAKKGAFFGNTWSGPRQTVDDNCLTREKGPVSKWNGNPAELCSLKLSPRDKNYAFIFHTKADLADVRLAVELVMTVTDIKGEIRGEEFGICWGVLPMVAAKNASDFSKKEDDMAKGSLFAGTPRLLLFLGADEAALSKQKNAKLPGGVFKYVSLKHTKADDSIMKLISSNELVGGDDSTLSVIPGVKDKTGAIEAGGGSLKKAASCVLVLKKLSVKVSEGLYACVNTHVKRSTGKDAKILGLMMEVGVHNGRRYVSKPKELELESGAGKGEYVCKKDCKMLEYMPHNMMAVIVLVFVNVDVDGDTGKMCIGWNSIVPSENAGMCSLLPAFPAPSRFLIPRVPLGLIWLVVELNHGWLWEVDISHQNQITHLARTCALSHHLYFSFSFTFCFSFSFSFSFFFSLSRTRTYIQGQPGRC